MPSHLEVVTVDCLVATPMGDPATFNTFYDHVRRTHSTKPLIVVSDGSDVNLRERIDADDYAVHVPYTKNGIPTALLTARIKRLTDRSLEGESDAATDDGKPAYAVRSQEFYALWAAAVLTYGVGDFLSTIVAVFAVPGLYEGNPVIDIVLRHAGIPGFLGVKIVIFILAIGVSVRGAKEGDRITYYAPPLCITALGIALTAWNVALIGSI